MYKKFLCIFLILLVSGISLTVNATSLEKNNEIYSVEKQRAALIETANAYERQGVQVQYDSYRKNLISSPEDATSQNYIYTVCSGFVYQVYYQTFGEDIETIFGDAKFPEDTKSWLKYAKSNSAQKDKVLLYYGTSKEIYSNKVLGTDKNNSNIEQLAKDIAKIAEVGDVFVVSGHAMLVESVDKTKGKESVTIIESWIGSSYKNGNGEDRKGGKYDYNVHADKFDIDGSVKKIDLKKCLKRYLVKTGEDRIEEMCLVRVLKDERKITKSAETRLKFPSIDIQKIATIKDSVEKQILMVEEGNEIKYKITIKNNSKQTYKNIKISEKIDSNVTVVDLGGGTLKNNVLTFNIPSVKAGKTVSKSYTVRVKCNVSGTLILSEGLVNNIATSKIEHVIGNKFNDEEIQKLRDSFEKLSVKSVEIADREFINEVYKSALGIDLKLTGLKNINIIQFNKGVERYDTESLVVRYTEIKDTVVKKYIYNNFYGLRIAAESGAGKVEGLGQWNIKAPTLLYDRARTILPDMLIDGDIILVYNEEANAKNQAYIFINGKLIRKTTKFYLDKKSGEELEEFLRNLCCDNYVILRPSIAIDKSDLLEELYIEGHRLNNK